MAKSVDDYKAEQRRLENKIYNQKRHNEKIAREIARLEDAYNKLGKIKRDNTYNADLVRDKTNLKQVAGNVKWKGNHKNQFDYEMKWVTTSAAKDFFNSIDEMQDEIGRALAKKRGEHDYGVGILNGLNRAWNSVVMTIRNWTN